MGANQPGHRLHFFSEHRAAESVWAAERPERQQLLERYALLHPQEDLRSSSERTIMMQKKNMHPKMPGTGSTPDVKSFLAGYYQRHRSKMSVLIAVVGVLFVVLLVAFSVSPLVPSIFTNTLTAIRANGTTCEHGRLRQAESFATMP